VSQPSKPIELFISYSHEDEELRQQFVKHLSILRRQELIADWRDRQILAGEEWAGEIDEHLNSSGIILLLISSSFLASNYCYDIEMKRAIERHEAGEAIVIPIILRACDWRDAPFSKLQALPKEGRHVKSWPDVDEAFLDVVRGIRRAVEQLRAKSDFSVASNREGELITRSILRPLLPYLCDRSEQESALGLGMRRHLERKSNHPILCLIHGDEMECHGEFLERLRYRSLPRLLDLDRRQISVKEYPLQRPPRRISGHQAFWSHYGYALSEDSSATREEILKFIARHEEPMMISWQLLTEDFEESGDALLESFIAFCADWPDLPSGRIVVNCVCLKYQRFDNTGFFDFRKKRLRQLNDRLRKGISQMNFEAHPNVSGIVLPELRAITRGDVESWSRSELVREFCRLQEKQIRELFENEGLCDKEGGIPMEALAEKLKQFVEG
jgi:hypothetical protein